MVEMNKKQIVGIKERERRRATGERENKLRFETTRSRFFSFNIDSPS